MKTFSPSIFFKKFHQILFRHFLSSDQKNLLHVFLHQFLIKLKERFLLYFFFISSSSNLCFSAKRTSKEVLNLLLLQFTWPVRLFLSFFWGFSLMAKSRRSFKTFSSFLCFVAAGAAASDNPFSSFFLGLFFRVIFIFKSFSLSFFIDRAGTSESFFVSTI